MTRAAVRLFLLEALGRLVLLLLGRFGLLVHGTIVREVSSLHGWKFCPRCRTELELGDGRVSCPACGFTAYAGSVPTASALCVDDAGRVLLARRAHEPERGKWDLPGGFLDEGEHPLDGLRRELHEGTGLEIEPEEFVGGFPDRYGEAGIYTINFYWTVRVVAGEPNAADDVADLRWFDADALPGPDEFAFPNSVAALRAWRGN